MSEVARKPKRMTDEQRAAAAEQAAVVRQESRAESEKGVRGKSPEKLFEERMLLSGGTTPREAAAEVVMVREHGETMSTAERRERISHWTEEFLKWVKKLGTEVRSAGGALIGVGDRVEVTVTGHYRFKW